MKRKYLSASVAKQVYCTSQQYYYVPVSLFMSGGKIKHINYSINVRDAIGKNGYLYLPHYVTNMIDKIVLDYYNQGELVIYEYNRKGDKRYADLKYHDSVLLMYLINRGFKENVSF